MMLPTTLQSQRVVKGNEQMLIASKQTSQSWRFSSKPSILLSSRTRVRNIRNLYNGIKKEKGPSLQKLHQWKQRQARPWLTRENKWTDGWSTTFFHCSPMKILFTRRHYNLLGIIPIVEELRKWKSSASYCLARQLKNSWKWWYTAWNTVSIGHRV